MKIIRMIMMAKVLPLDHPWSFASLCLYVALFARNRDLAIRIEIGNSTKGIFALQKRDNLKRMILGN